MSRNLKIGILAGIVALLFFGALMGLWGVRQLWHQDDAPLTAAQVQENMNLLKTQINDDIGTLKADLESKTASMLGAQAQLKTTLSALTQQVSQSAQPAQNEEMSALLQKYDVLETQVSALSEQITQLQKKSPQKTIVKTVRAKAPNTPVTLPFVPSRVEVWGGKPIVIVNQHRVAVGEHYQGFKLIEVNQHQSRWQNMQTGKIINAKVQP